MHTCVSPLRLSTVLPAVSPYAAVAAASPDYTLQSGSPALFRGLHSQMAGSGGGAGQDHRRGGRGGRNPRPFPNDPLFSQQWHWPAVNAPSAWHTGTGSRTVRM